MYAYQNWCQFHFVEIPEGSAISGHQIRAVIAKNETVLDLLPILFVLNPHLHPLGVSIKLKLLVPRTNNLRSTTWFPSDKEGEDPYGEVGEQDEEHDGEVRP